MDNKFKRIFIGLVIPTVVIILVCIGFFDKNASGSLLKIKQQAEEKEAREHAEGTVSITEENWQEYFTMSMEEEQEYNSDNELVKVKYVLIIRLKEEYWDEIVYSDDKRNEAIFNGCLYTDHMIYEITDAEHSDWEIVEKYRGTKSKGASDKFTQSWWMTEANVFEQEYEFESFEKKDKLILEIPGDFQVEAAAGTLYFKE